MNIVSWYGSMSGGGCLQFSCDNRVVNSAVSGIALTGVFSVSENLTSRRVGVGLILISNNDHNSHS